MARLVGESLGPFAVVVTSASPRAMETTVAMDFAVDDTVELPSGYVPGEVDHHDQWRWPSPQRSYAKLIGRGGGLATRRRDPSAHLDDRRCGRPPGCRRPGRGARWRDRARAGGLPDADPELWGAPFGHCDGARLGFDGGSFVSVRFRRRPSEQLPGGAKAGGR